MNTNQNHQQIWTTEEQRKLIAAAPELLAILQLAERYLTHPDVVEVTKNFALSGEVINRRIAAVIEKATATVELIDTPKNFQIIKLGNSYRADEIINGVGYFSYHCGDNITALVEELESAYSPKPVVTFDTASRLDFYRSLPDDVEELARQTK